MTPATVVGTSGATQPVARFDRESWRSTCVTRKLKTVSSVQPGGETHRQASPRVDHRRTAAPLRHEVTESLRYSSEPTAASPSAHARLRAGPRRGRLFQPGVSTPGQTMPRPRWSVPERDAYPPNPIPIRRRRTATNPKSARLGWAPPWAPPRPPSHIHPQPPPPALRRWNDDRSHIRPQDAPRIHPGILLPVLRPGQSLLRRALRPDNRPRHVPNEQLRPDDRAVRPVPHPPPATGTTATAVSAPSRRSGNGVRVSVENGVQAV